MTAFQRTQPMHSPPPKPSLALYRESDGVQWGEIRKVFCAGCAFHYTPKNRYGDRAHRCRRFAEYEIDCVTGESILSKPADCYQHNAGLDCQYFEPRRTLWARFLDWLGS